MMTKYVLKFLEQANPSEVMFLVMGLVICFLVVLLLIDVYRKGF